MMKKVARRSVLGALLAAWWAEKMTRSDSTLGLYDVLVLAGLGFGWLLEKKTEDK
jgi:hypothetical protein